MNLLSFLTNGFVCPNQVSSIVNRIVLPVNAKVKLNKVNVSAEGVNINKVNIKNLNINKIHIKNLLVKSNISNNTIKSHIKS